AGALAGCPDAETARTGYRLHSAVDGTVTEVTSVDGRTSITRKSDNLPASQTYFRLHPLNNKCPNGATATFEWTPPVESLRLPSVGETQQAHAITTDCKGERHEIETSITAIGRGSVEIGECRYSTLSIERTTKYDGQAFTKATIEFSPELGWTLR